VNPVTALSRIAHYVGTVDGIRASVYPLPKQLPPGICFVPFWDETIIHHSRLKLWEIKVQGQLTVPMQGSIPQESGALDPIAVAIVDRFDSTTNNGDAFRLVSPDDGKPGVPFCQVGRIQPAQEIEYAGLTRYGAVIWFDLKLERFANGD
jgi:hypothetical protein